MGRPGVMLYFDFRHGLKILPVDKRCAIYEAILDYAESGIVPSFDDPASRMFWEMVRPRLDADAESYMQKVEKRRSAANCRWNAIESTNMQTDANAQYALEKEKKEKRTELEKEIDIIADKPPSRPRFCPPSEEDVRGYCNEKGYTSIDPERFVDHYTANGWKVGKNPMKDWKATVRTWAKRDKEEKENGKPVSELAELGKTIGVRL